MRIQEVHRAYFGSFLFLLRHHLAMEEGYSEAISYADTLAASGFLEGFANGVAVALDRAARFEAMLGFELKSRRLSDSHRAATSSYLAHLREHQLVYSPLPLVKAGAQDRAGARIKDIFVPIAVRTKKAERDGGMQSVRRHPDEGGAKQNSTELGALILSEGRVVLLGPPGGGKTTMLKRAALALAEGRSEDIPGWGDPLGARSPSSSG